MDLKQNAPQKQRQRLKNNRDRIVSIIMASYEPAIEITGYLVSSCHFKGNFTEFMV